MRTRYPPRLPGMREVKVDIPDGGVWHDCIRDLAETLRPAAIVQGHMHRWNGTSQTYTLGGRPTLIRHPGWTGGTLPCQMTTASRRWCGRIRRL